MFSLALVFSSVRLEKIHFRIGILERNGVPLLVLLLLFSSNPPSRIISSFLTLICDLNVRVTFPGGAVVAILSVKSDWVTSISRVIWSSPETIGVMITANSASTGL